MTDLSRTIPDVLLSAAAQWPDRVAIKEGKDEITFAELKNKALRAARAFVAHGVTPGTPFALWAPNVSEWIWLAIGGQMAGGVLVPLNTRYKGIEAGEILQRSKCELLFTVAGFLDTNYPAMLSDRDLPDLRHTFLMKGEDGKTPAVDTFLDASSHVEESQVTTLIDRLSGDSLSDIMYTSGTTGSPKGVMSSHGQVVAIFENWSRCVGLSASDRYLIVNPFFHTFGYKSGWLTCLLTGATIYPEPLFDVGALLQRISKERITILPGAPTVFQSLLQHKDLKQFDLSSLRCAVTGAATVPEQLVKDMHAILGFDRVYTGYGLTECGVVSICDANDSIEIVANTAGRPIDGIEVKIVGEDGHTLSANNTGNIKVKGFNVMQGYLDDDEATRETIDAEGWLDTGDIGWQNETGHIKVTDRVKDMFICGGFNCYPAEIEHLLLRHPLVLDVAVLGVADERMGEVGHAFIVTADNTRLEQEDWRKWAKETMANYKVPRRFTHVDTLPRNASGKVQKFKLRTDP